ncbi:class I SAM-dependent methyltransferase [Endozoicomonas sp. SM1973]|uniref:Class I SAM-dependent methyltransferase n=1 Tax=Spartinivicinus marinus TaxID=2994442 RepID=A0A853HZ80_9GAMM|nr:class I SAM-dependent methyltransferase [Spartinivicinus marinus]MCX4028334.1 class I SAM-dependent methyltransferase [Spartinivicinus marinus]NYZ65669.1 class I SAM-dependent methyltransferase [Spartinivicinus marinus]
MNKYRYQEKLSKVTPILLDSNYKQPKVDKMISILTDCGALSSNRGLAIDIGCSAGFFTRALSPYFDNVVGLDIDDSALTIACQKQTYENITYMIGDSMKLPFSDNSVNLVICNHVYEHVPDAERLFEEIERVLSNEGVCYLGAASRLTIIEPHYKLPFLSWLPKLLANKYIKIFNKGNEYYENLKTPWGIKRLISKFYVKDYTLEIVYYPDKYCARDLITKGGFIEKVPKFLWVYLYNFLPSFILILKK